ncbi:hypothetical protein BGW42_003373 [Actinomortierella wolfii]|nr:hypothetical protein BGW42_003373 [Actinomortierella wolfii]
MLTAKFVAILGFVAALASAVVVPVEETANTLIVDVQPRAEKDITPNNNNPIRIMGDCDVHYEVYEDDDCDGRSTGICNKDACRDLRGMGSESVTVGNNANGWITVKGYTKFGCEGSHVALVQLAPGGVNCMRYSNGGFYSLAYSYN